MSDRPPSARPLYREHAPRRALARHVECYWTARARIGPGGSIRDRVLPDGCMDILFSFGDAPSSGGADTPESQVVGTMTRPLDVEYGGEVHLLGVRFRPGGARAYLPAEAAALTDESAPLEDLWGRAAGEVWERLVAAPDSSERVAILDRVLLDRLQRARVSSDEPVLRASEAAAAAIGGRTSHPPSVDAMAAAAGLGRRQLERRFLAAVGIPPKTAFRVARFRDAVARLHAHPTADLARIALEAGYADQPHFTREFRALAGTTPGAYRRERLGGTGMAAG